MKKYATFSLLIIALAFLFGSCAQELNPTGGAKDTIPPKVTKTNPKNETLNYGGGDLKFTFDEPIQKPDVKKDIFISPFVNRPRVILSDNGKRLTLKLEEELRPQTTYVITLNGIKDLRERNQIAEPYTLAFSTGDQLDSLELEGQIVNTEGKGVKEMLVLMFDADSVIGNDILNKRPAYLNRTDESGNFSFKFLRSASYRVFGVADGDQSNTYNQPTEAVAMAADSVITLVAGDSSSTNTIRLTSFVVDDTPPGLRRFFWTNDSTLAVQLSEAIRLSAMTIFVSDTAGTDSLPIAEAAYVPGTDKELWMHIPGGKRWLDLHLIGLQDSLGNGPDSVVLLRIDPSRERSWKEPLSIKPKLLLDLPAIEFLPGRFVSESDRRYFSLTDTASVDSVRKSWELSWMPEGLYQRIRPTSKEAIEVPLVLRIEGAFFYGENDSLDRDTVFSFPVQWLKKEGYGTLNGKVIPDSTYDGPLIIRLMGPGEKSGVARSFSDTTFSFTNIAPGDYTFEVIYDADGNGILTTGSLTQYRLPERRKKVPGSISIRANWDFEDHIVDLNATAPEPVAEPDPGDEGELPTGERPPGRPGQRP